MTTLQIQMREMATLMSRSVKSVQYVRGLTMTQHLITEARVSSQIEAVLNAYFVITCFISVTHTATFQTQGQLYSYKLVKSV